METRVEIIQVTAELDESNIKIKVEWNLVDSEITSVTEVMA